MGASPLLLTILTLSFFLSETESVSLQIVNKCNYTIWPGILSTGRVNLSTTGFTLVSGASFNLSVPNSWTGTVWARTLCNEYSSGNFSCFTTDCRIGKIECDGNNRGSPPATVAEFSLNRTGGMDFYDVSIVNGFNLPMVVEPRGAGSSNCSSPGCSADLNGSCPKVLRVASEGSQGPVVCMSACTKFNTPMDCCTQISSPTTC